MNTKIKTAALWFSLILFLIVLLEALRTILEHRFPFVRDFNDATRQAYILLVLSATVLFVWTRPDLHVESWEVAGLKVSVGQLQQKVETLSDQMQVFFKSKRIEVFNRNNWDRIRRVGKPENGVVLEMTLEQEPIRGSIEVYEGVLLILELEYHTKLVKER